MARALLWQGSMRFATELAPSYWTVPVPVKRSRFVAMEPGYDPYNVETDLAALGAFGNEAPPAAGAELLHLHADLRTMPTMPAAAAGARGGLRRRLGAARAGVYRGAYLEGVGRTTLAGHWADRDARGDGSGQLLPSAAVREMLLGQILGAMGAGSLAARCAGLLARPHERPALVDALLAAMMPRAAGRFAMIDRRFHALTVKPADFARAANFLWALDHVGTGEDFVRMLEAMHRALLPPSERAAAPPGAAPHAIAGAWRGAVDRGLANHRALFRAGITWGGAAADVSADGRVLDLAGTVVVVRPFFGATRVLVAGATSAREWRGLEVLAFARASRAVLGALRARLRHLGGDDGLPRGTARELAAALASALDDALPAEHPIWSRAALAALATDAVLEALGLGSAGAARVRALAERQLDAFERGVVPDWSDLALRRLEVRVAGPEPGVELCCEVPDFAVEAYGGSWDLASLYNDGLRWIEASDSLDELFARTQATARSLEVVVAAGRETGAPSAAAPPAR
jgi:hypothetical protein